MCHTLGHRLLLLRADALAWVYHNVPSAFPPPLLLHSVLGGLMSVTNNCSVATIWCHALSMMPPKHNAVFTRAWIHIRFFSDTPHVLLLPPLPVPVLPLPGTHHNATAMHHTCQQHPLGSRRCVCKTWITNTPHWVEATGTCAFTYLALGHGQTTFAL